MPWGAIGAVASAGLGGAIESGSSSKQRGFNRDEAVKTRSFESTEATKARDFSASQSKKTRKFESSEAQINRDYQERMSSTAHQRGVEDMKSAGINPMVGYLKGGGGASSPGGSKGSASPGGTSKAGSATASATKADTARAVTTGMSSALGVRRLAKEVKQADAQVQLTNTTNDKIDYEKTIAGHNARSAKAKADYDIEMYKNKAFEEKGKRPVLGGKVLRQNSLNLLYQVLGSSAKKILKRKLYRGASGKW